jgi:NAD-dependent SIR2 family protein deacetylase
MNKKKLVVLTGAGISAESGLKTFIIMMVYRKVTISKMLLLQNMEEILNWFGLLQ